MKTLKDIPMINLPKELTLDYNYEDGYSDGWTAAIVDFKRQLKKSSIEDIKLFKKNNENWATNEWYRFADSGMGEYTDDAYGNIIRWIKHFFNITEDDLK